MQDFAEMAKIEDVLSGKFTDLNTFKKKFI